jgi:hypothetical protein
MASISVSKTVGQNEFQVTAGTAAPGAGDMEFRVDLTKLTGGNIQVFQFLDELRNYFVGKIPAVN